ncbi:hypothetical protein Tco_0687321 [Tanacetum coccineum]
MPASPEPNWIIPSNDLLEAENNWADALAESYKDPEENKLLSKTRDMGAFIKWYYKWIGKKKLTKADLEGLAFNVVKGFHDNSISLQFQMEECHLLLTDKIDLMNPEGQRVVPYVSKSLPLGGPPGQVTIQAYFFFNKDLEYLVYGKKERRYALSISKLKAARYLDFGLEELVSSLWIESECEYDVSAKSNMQILSVVSLKTYEKYGYAYLKEIVLHRADYEEYKISEADFKNLHPNNFEDLDRNDQKKMMRLNEVHKFSDGTLMRIQDKLAYMVKDFKLFMYNKGMESRI